MRNEAKSTLEGRVTRVPICLSASGTPFSGGISLGDPLAVRAETIRDLCNSSLQLFTKRSRPHPIPSPIRWAREPRAEHVGKLRNEPNHAEKNERKGAEEKGGKWAVHVHPTIFTKRTHATVSLVSRRADWSPRYNENCETNPTRNPKPETQNS